MEKRPGGARQEREGCLSLIQMSKTNQDLNIIMLINHSCDLLDRMVLNTSISYVKRKYMED